MAEGLKRYRSDEERRAAVAGRDRGADQSFVYSVASTGVYCLPSCPSRQARPEHLAFYDSPADAERAGFRACRRCRPDLASDRRGHVQAVLEACRRIENADRKLALAELAEGSDLSTHHFHRTFVRVTGITPGAYHDAIRLQRITRELQRRDTVTDAIYSAGYSSASRFYDGADERLGMSPQAYRRAGEGEVIRFCLGSSSLGSVLVASSRIGVCAILLGHRPSELTADLARRFRKARLVPADPSYAEVVDAVIRLIDAPADAFGLPMDIRGTAFQRRVWEQLRKIPAGHTASYAQIAQQIDRPAAHRAVAGACAANPLAVAIPCHRVVGSDGKLGGYRWGVETKAALLARESPVRSSPFGSTPAGPASCS